MKLRTSGSTLAIALALGGAAGAQTPALATLPPPAPGQSDAPAVAEVIVTAQRRSENIQKAPIAIEAVSSAQLARRNLTSGEDLSDVTPGLAFKSFGPITDLFIRGVGNSNNNVYSDPDVVFNIDGVPLALPNGPDGTFYDIDRIEVLKGPQGTLYGRNATSGAVNVITNDPQFHYAASAEIQAGDYGLFQTRDMINIPITDTLAIRGALAYTRHEGYLTDGYDDADDVAGRIKLLWKPRGDITVHLSGDYYHQGGKGGAYVPQTAAGQYYNNPKNPYQANEFYPNNATGLGAPGGGGVLDLVPNDGFNNNQSYSIYGQLDWRLPFATLTVIPAFRQMRQDFLTHSAGFGFLQQERDNSRTLETRLGSDRAFGDRLKWTVGGFVLNEDLPNFSTIQQSFEPVGSSVPEGSQSVSTPKDHTESYAIFGQSTYSVLNWLRLTGGLRWTSDSKREAGFQTSTYPPNFFPPGAPPGTGTISYNIDSKVKSTRVTYRVGFDADLAPRVLLYGNYATGYKVGGFSSGDGDNPALTPNATFRPEDIRAYDLGLKSQFFDHRIQVNLETFYWIYLNQQVNTIFFDYVPPGGLVLFPTDANAGHGDDTGADLDVTWAVTRNDTFNASVEYLHAYYKSFQYPFIAPGNIINDDGKPFNYAPRWAADLGFTHIWRFGPATLEGSVNSHLSTSQWIGYSYIPGSQQQGAYSKTSLNLTYHAPGNHWYVGGWAKNLEDTAVKTVAEQDLPGSTFDNTGQPLQWVGLEAPRTFGFTLGANF